MFLGYHYNYCNPLLSGCPQSVIRQLQRVQNNAARLILRLRKTEHISPHLASLHWLPVSERIHYKISTIVYNTVYTTLPRYLYDLLSLYTPARPLRSAADTSALCVPSVRTATFGFRSFSHSGPTVWNSLPLHIRSSDSVSKFKCRVKTHLFDRAYNSV